MDLRKKKNVKLVKKWAKYEPYNETIFEFMKEKDEPKWFRALSDRQMEAADSLLKNLREDFQQETTHRTRYLLECIGIDPITRSSNLRVAIILSRGSDLAFLWFLQMLFYSKPDYLTNPDYKFNTSEQLLMSTTAHLDMITTLRELDRILPPQGKKIIPKKKEIIKKKRNTEGISPYLWPLVDPILEKPRKFPPPLYYSNYKKMPDDKYKDQNYQVANEKFRWFADCECMPKPSPSSTNIVRCILEEEINRIFEKKKVESAEARALCKTHKFIEHKKRLFMLKLQVEAYKRCLDYFDLKDREVKRKKEFYCHLKQNLLRIKYDLEMLSQSYKTISFMRLLIRDVIDDSMEPKPRAENICKQSDKWCPPRMMESDLNPPEVKEPSELICDFGHSGPPKANQIYFHANKVNNQFSFDFGKIFDEKDLVPENDPFKYIQKVFSHHLDYEQFETEEEAIENYFEKLWFIEVEAWNQKLDEERRKQEEEEAANEHLLRFRLYDEGTGCDTIGKDTAKLNEKIIFFNPRNKRVMDKLLKDGLKKMNENPFFVLAALPDAYKLNSLRDWVKRRYGYIPNDKERAVALKKSKQILQMMINMYGATKTGPLFNKIFKYKLLWTLNKNYIICQIQDATRLFYFKMKNRFLEDTRVYWEALENYLLPSGPQRELFYAYEPARPQDIIVFTPWHTFVDQYNELVRKQRQKLNKIK